MLGAEYNSVYTLYSIYIYKCHFMVMTIYLLLSLVGNGCQLNLPRGKFNDCKWPTWQCESEKQLSYNLGKEAF